jgi:hypothetical protein
MRRVEIEAVTNVNHVPAHAFVFSHDDLRPVRIDITVDRKLEVSVGKS